MEEQKIDILRRFEFELTDIVVKKNINALKSIFSIMEKKYPDTRIDFFGKEYLLEILFPYDDEDSFLIFKFLLNLPKEKYGRFNLEKNNYRIIRNIIQIKHKKIIKLFLKEYNEYSLNWESLSQIMTNYFGHNYREKLLEN